MGNAVALAAGTMAGMGPEAVQDVRPLSESARGDEPTYESGQPRAGMDGHRTFCDWF